MSNSAFHELLSASQAGAGQEVVEAEFEAVAARIRAVKQQLTRFSLDVGGRGICRPNANDQDAGKRRASAGEELFGGGDAGLPEKSAGEQHRRFFIKLKKQVAQIQEEVRLCCRINRRWSENKDGSRYWNEVRKSGTKYGLRGGRVQTG